MEFHRRSERARLFAVMLGSAAALVIFALALASAPAWAARAQQPGPTGMETPPEPAQVAAPNSIPLPDGGTCTGCVGTAFTITNTGTGRAGYFLQSNTSATAPALEGRTTSSAGGAIALYGSVAQTNAGINSAGMRGNNTSTNANGYGVFGSHSGTGVGVYGTVTGAGKGVYGRSAATSGVSYGVYGQVASPDGIAGYFQGYNPAGSYGVAVRGLSGGGDLADIHPSGTYKDAAGEFAGPTGVIGAAASTTHNTGGYGVVGISYGSSGIGVNGRATGYDGVGVYGQGLGGSGIGVYGSAPTTSFAGYFNGNLVVTGNFSNTMAVSVIDHPLDPANRTLAHASVESPDLKNVYDGVAVLDARGEAWVQMPSYFDVLNGEFRYQLTTIGGFAPVYIAQEISANRFKIAGGKAGMKVSWQVTGIRQDSTLR